MKTKFLKGIFLLCCISLLLSTCSSDDDDGTPNNSAEIAQIRDQVIDGTWRVTNFVDSGQNETSDFNGYSFTFNSNGNLSASNGTTTETGNWSITNSSSSSSSSSDDIDFNINFNVPDTNDFEDLNDDWDVVSHTDTKIVLIDISGGNGGTDNLTFEKN